METTNPIVPDGPASLIDESLAALTAGSQRVRRVQAARDRLRDGSAWNAVSWTSYARGLRRDLSIL
jgi:hypothetical protein